ncbi:helix-turn-helix domain-containing protein [Amycolatopsis sp. NPDC059027]|uniref:PucR family transcriptional regulator n=1 Tax=Amycolatopsis sp. NPDC059027 TaxID=3346709 RepID=UPI00366E38F6
MTDTDTSGNPLNTFVPATRFVPSAERSGLPAIDNPWLALPHNLANKFRPGAHDVAQEILAAIQRAIPAYARPLEGAFGKVITEGIDRAVVQFIERVANPANPHENDADLFRRLGELQTVEGDGVEALQNAYHVGARVAWQRIADFGQAANLSLPTVCLLGDMLFAYVEEMSALSVQGFAAAKARTAGVLERRRRRLLNLLLDGPSVSRRELADLAELARWKLPAQVIAVALARDDAQPDLPVLAMDDRVLADLDGDEPCLVVAAHEDRLPDLETGLAGGKAAVGPRVRPADVAVSLRHARRALDLVQRGILPDAPLTWSDDHLTTFWLLADEFLARALVARSLAPLARLTTKQRARLSETLLAWLETRGGAPEIAQRLDIHPQTVRYRLRRIKSLFGDRLDDPDEHFELEVALRAQRLLDTAAHTG